MSVLVSVICATYNHVSFISQCLEGLVNQQTSFDYEILINDDASTDGTADIVRDYAVRYPGKIRAVLQRENQYSRGVEISIGILYPLAEGKYIAECEGDDYWTDSLKLQKQVDYLETHPEVPMCYTSAKVYNNDREAFDKGVAGSEYMGYESLLFENPVPAMTACFRRDILLRYLDQVHPLEHHWATADYPKWLFMAECGPLAYIPEVTGVYRDFSPASISHPRDYSSRLAFLLSIMDVSVFYARRNGYWESCGAAILAHYERLCVGEGIRYHQYDKAAQYLATCKALSASQRLILRLRMAWGRFYHLFMR